MPTWETVAVSAALLHMMARPDTSVDIIHGVQHFAARESHQLADVCINIIIKNTVR